MTRIKQSLAVGKSFAYFSATKHTNKALYDLFYTLGKGNLAKGYMIASNKLLNMKNRLGDISIKVGTNPHDRTKLVNTIVEMLPSTQTEEQRRKRTEDLFTKLTAILAKVAGDECLRSMKRIFILNSRFIRADKLTPSMPVQRWIPNVYTGHLEDLQKRIATLDTLVQTSHEQFEEQFNAEDDAGNRDLLAVVLQNISLKLGALLRYWQANIRPNQMFAIQCQALVEESIDKSLIRIIKRQQG
jgi:hypothetical protein